MSRGSSRTAPRAQRTRDGGATGRRRWLAAATAALMGGGLGLVALAAPAQATLTSTLGPVDAGNGFPAYYQDTSNLRLEPCLDGPPLCSAGGDPVAPDGRAFYSRATATIDDVGVNRTATARLVLALEAAHAGPDSGQQVTFGRIRFTTTGGLTAGAAYKVTHPYGVDTFVADADGAVQPDAGTQDIGALGPCLGPNAHEPGGACDFAEATTGRIGPFLRWDPAAAPAAPSGYVGNPSVDHTILGSPNNTDYLQIEGPNIGGPGVNLVRTKLFRLQGKIAGPVLATPARLAFGSTQVRRTAPAQSVAVQNIGLGTIAIEGVSVSTAPGDSAGFLVDPGTCTAGKVLARDATCTLTVRFSPGSVTGTHRATVLLRHDGLRSPERIPLTGSAAATGTAPAVALAPESLAFAGQRLTTRSAAKRVTVTNDGSADLDVSAVSLSGPDAADFSASDRCVGKVVPAGGSCTIDVRFAPRVTAGDKSATLTVTDDAAGSPHTVTVTGRADGGLTAVGATDRTGFPSSYTDANGTTLQLCLDGRPNCPTSAANLVPPDGEAFYNSATAQLATRNNGRFALALALQGRFAGPRTGQEIVFSRIRFIESGGLRPSTVYTVTHPFGTDRFTSNSRGELGVTRGTQDTGARGPCGAAAHEPGGACDFATAMTGRFGPFLTWAPNPADPSDVPPKGYVGDATTAHRVTGSPLGTNFLRIQGPDVNPSSTKDACPTVDGLIADCVQTDLFVVAGKLAGTR